MSKKRKHTMTPAPDDETVETGLDDAVNAALEKAEGNMNAKALAAAEEQAALQARRTVEAQQEELPHSPTPPAEDLTELPLASIAARGRDALLEAMRQHQLKKENETPYTPPPLTDRQMERRNEELEAGRKAQARAAAQQAEQRELAAKHNLATFGVKNTPQATEGHLTPVHRPGLSVPDPRNGKSTGHGVYSPDA